MTYAYRGFAFAFIAVVLGGCAAIGSKSSMYDSKERSLAGTITVSDPKLYSREALINERNREMARLQKLMDESNEDDFGPEIYREVERISAFSAALGLKFDPAAGLDYRRDQEGDKVQHEINMLRLQLQLDQLKRDAEIMRSKFAEQTAPVNPNLGVSASAALGASTGKVEPAALDQLKAQIDAMIASMKAAFSTQAAKIVPTEASSSPFDRFRDQQAYLDMVKSARNAASLDDLHDHRGSALVRLNFQATVVPDPKAPKSLGVVQVKVKPQCIKETAKRLYVEEWMRSINERASANGGFDVGSDVAELERLGVVHIDRRFGQAVAMPSAGSDSDNKARDALLGEARWDDRSVSYANSLSWFSSSDENGRAKGLAEACGTGKPGVPRSREVMDFMQDLHRAKARILTYDYQIDRDRWSPDRRKIASPDELTQAEEFINTARGKMSNVSACASAVAKLRAEREQQHLKSLIEKFSAATLGSGVRIYEVGPREQVQQLSTTARAADSIGLALSIAAAAPGAGQAANAGLGYQRQVANKVSAIERVPSVVGYTLGGRQTFGWVLGPRAVVDANHAGVDVEHRLKPYDLSVDLSVPAWWSSVELEVETQWGPKTAELASGNVKSEITQSCGTKQPIVVPIERKAADYDWFTSALLGSVDSGVRIDRVTGTVNACGESSLLLEGRNVWRAQTVMVLGQSLPASDFSIAPDMRGILVKAPKISPTVAAMQKDRSIWVISPHGRDRHDLEYAGTPSGDACNGAAPAAPAAAAKQMTISSMSPDLRFAVPSDIEITVKGKNLDMVKKATLHGQRGILTPSGPDQLKIVFPLARTRSIPVDEVGAKLELLDGAGKPLDSRLVRVSKAGGI